LAQPAFQIADHQTIDREQWRRFVLDNPHGTVFHTPEMFDVFQAAAGHNPFIFSALNPEGRMQALITPVMVSLREGALKSLSTRAVHYGGMVFNETDEGIAALKMLLEYSMPILGREAIYSESRNLTDVGRILPVFKDLKFNREPHINYWIRLDRSYEDIIMNVKSSARGAMRRSEKRGAQFLVIEDAQGFEDWFSLVELTYLHKKMPLADRSFFENIFKIARPAGLAKFFAVKAENRLIGAYLMMLFKDVIYFWYSADDYHMRQYYPTDGFINYIIQWGIENQFRILDFGWAGREDEPYGVREFKAKFGGDEIRFGRHIRTHKPAMRAFSNAGFMVYKKILGLKRK
jgi:serine/alanine adding enzyme